MTLRVYGCKHRNVDNSQSLPSDSKLYTNFEFCEEKNHPHFKNLLIYKAKQIMMTKIISKKILQILRRQY
jgi:hypothetical protein